MLSWLIIARVFRGGGITIYRIYGAIAVYLLLGILWGEFYILIYLFQPGSFYFNPSTQYGEPPISELIYFSFTTLTTLGVGDILPVHPIARSMTTLEALVGQLYPRSCWPASSPSTRSEKHSRLHRVAGGHSVKP